MIRRLDLFNFKAFKRFTITFGDKAFLVGPNNAGKSTIMAALRLCAHMLRHASRVTASNLRRDGDSSVRAYPFESRQFEFLDENLRHEFQPHETRLEVRFASKARLVAIWPADAEAADVASGAFFYLVDAKEQEIARPKTVKEHFDRIGVIPVLSPIEPRESVLKEDHLHRYRDTRLASRHFRNHLRLLQSVYSKGHRTCFDDFLDFVKTWTPELMFEAEALRTRLVPGGRELDLFYREVGSRTDRELVWAGDGVQIWLQLLLHVFLERETPTIILDEPDVYLHADLQRRLVKLLETLSPQMLMATHSSEVLGEAEQDAIIWVDKSRKSAIKAPSGPLLSKLSDTLGSQFNLKLARTLRARVTLFVEGDDMKILSAVARTLGAITVAQESRIAAVQLEGFSKWEHTEAFGWLTKTMLQDAFAVHAILDRDYRSDAATEALTSRLAKAGVIAHVWQRKEIESYLLVPEAIARLTKAKPGWIDEVLHKTAETMESDVFSKMLDERHRVEVAERHHRVNITAEFKSWFHRQWANREWRRTVCPPKELMAMLNQELQVAGFKSVSFLSLAKALQAHEIPTEMAGLVKRLEQLANPE